MKLEIELKYKTGEQVFFIEDKSSIITIAKVDGYTIETISCLTFIKYKIFYYKADGIYTTWVLDENQLFASINEAYDYYMKNYKSRYE